MMKSSPFASAGFTDLGSMFLSVIMFGCLLIAALLILASLPAVVHTIYPACGFVKDLGQFSLSRNLLIVPACIAFSWLLARVQKNTFTLDGVGTALHGHIPTPDRRGYIATKWLVFMLLPLLPVRSYQIDGEYSKSAYPRSEVMHPLHELHWDQIRETVWQSKWWYALAAILWIGVGVWSLVQCM